jgi:phytoene desaturase
MRIAIVGAGVGGLAAGIECARLGHRVVVLEQSAAAGGKCAEVRAEGFRWDAGPSLLTMPHVFAELFAATGRPLADELELRRVEPVTRYAFADGTQVDLSADLAASSEALEALGPGLATDWTRFLGTCAGMWRAAVPFLEGPAPWPPRRPEPGQPRPDPRDALRVKPWWTLRQLARAHTRDPRLRQVIERFATYAGADPRRAPAALALGGYVEHAFGAWYPAGGLHALVRAMVRRLTDLGGELRLRTPVRHVVVRGGRVVGVDTGILEPADAVVTDVDELAVRRHLLGRSDVRERRPSLSGLALMLGLRGDPAEAHHRILFPADLDAEFDDIFDGQRPPRDPTIYVAAPAVSDPSCAPDGHDAWFVLVNAPAVGDGADWAAVEQAVLRRLDVGDRLVVRRRRTPGDLQRETGAVEGAIYGGAPHGRLASLRRPGARVRGVSGLWMAGGTVHPGGGLPLVALGGRSVARQIGRA